MDFISFMRDLSEKLNSRHYINYLWNELQDIQQEEVDAISTNDFINHLPLIYDQFWEMALEKVEQQINLQLDDIDDELRKYILVLIYHSLSHETLSQNTILHSSQVFFELITLRNEDFFHSKIFRNILINLQACLNMQCSQNSTNSLIRKLRKFLGVSKLSNSDLEITLATLIQIVFITSTEIFLNFELAEEEERLKSSYEALLSLKKLFESETVPLRKFLILTYFFNGLRPYSSGIITATHLSIIQTNFRNLLKSLHNKLEEDEYKSFMNAFIHIWQHPDFLYYSEAVTIMNNLNKRYYTTLIDILHKMVLSKNCHKNLFKLSCAIISNPPKFNPEEKIIVTNEVLLKNIMLNCLSDKNDIANSALDSFAEIFLSALDLEKKIIKEPILAIINGSEKKNDLTVPIILRGFKTQIKKRWAGSKNKQLFAIIVSIMSLSTSDYPDLYREILDILCDEVSPFDLKPFLALISNSYIKLYEQNQIESSFQLLKILMKCALHPMATSAEFLKFLYSSMISQMNPTRSEYFITAIISENFHFEEFFQKCHNLHLIKNEHVENLVNNLRLMRECNLKLLSAIIHRTDFRNLRIILDYSTQSVLSSENLNYLFYIYSHLLRNNPTNFDYNEETNREMLNFLRDNLRNLCFGSCCIGSAFSLYKQLGRYTDLEADFRSFKDEYDTRILEVFQEKNQSVLLYYSQLVIFARIIPEENTLSILSEYLQNCTSDDFRKSEDFDSEFWIACLFLYTNICVIRTSCVENGIDFLLNAQNSSNTEVKLAALNMTFDLCNLVTHNFEDLIKYMFKQLVFGDHVYKRTCLKKIDRLIRDEYLKLDANQFIIFVSMVEDRNFGLGDYLTFLLLEHFLIQKTLTIAQHFVTLVVHINLYRKHSLYQICDEEFNLIRIATRNITSRKKIYKLLFTNLSIKTRLNIICILSSTILEKMITNSTDIDGNFIKVITDSVFIFKLTSNKTRNEEESDEIYYRKVLQTISRKILQKPHEITYKVTLMDHHKEIQLGTESLMRLLYSCTDVELKIEIFDAIIYWTDFFIEELAFMVQVDKKRQFEGYYQKLEKFYMQNFNSIRNMREVETFTNMECNPVFPSTSNNF